MKIRLFGWLLIRRRLVMRALRHHMLPDTPASCPLCGGGPEDCLHLFLQCPMVQEAWRAAVIDRLPTSSEEAFWSSLAGGYYRRNMEWRQIFATLWAIWLHRNEVIFRDATPSGDAIIHAVGGLILSWNLGGVGPSIYVSLDR